MATWEVACPQPDRKQGLPTCPAVRYGQGAVAYDAYMVVTHGYYLDLDAADERYANFLDDTWAYDTVSKKWAKWALYSAQAPCPRFYMAVCCDGEAMYLFGGTDGAARTNGATNFLFGPEAQMNDLWRLPLGTTAESPMRNWQPLVANSDDLDAAPRKREQTALACAGGKLWVFGGLAGDIPEPDGLEALGDLWTFDGPSGWTRAKATGEAPAARFGHKAVHDRDAFLVVGGRERLKDDEDRRALLGEVWRCDVSHGPDSVVWSLLCADPMLKRVDFALCRDGNELLIYGGNDSEQLLSNLPPDGVLYDLEFHACAPLPVSGTPTPDPEGGMELRVAPYGRIHASLCAFPTNDQHQLLLLFGGESTQPYMYHGSVYEAKRLRPASRKRAPRPPPTPEGLDNVDPAPPPAGAALEEKEDAAFLA